MNRSRYYRDFVRAQLRAFYSGFEITDTVVIIIIVGLALWSLITGAHSDVHPPGWVVAVIAAFFVVYRLQTGAYRLYASQRADHEALKLRLTPELGVGTPQIVPTMLGSPQALATARAMGMSATNSEYLRLPVVNHTGGIARNCTARLLKVEVIDRNDQWRALGYHDTLQMAWSNKAPPHQTELDIHPNTTEVLDVVFAKQGSRNLHLATAVHPASYANLLNLPGQYQFTIQITSADRGPVIVQVRCHWGLNMGAFNLTGDPVTVLG